jgi:hypothetical protein
MGSSTALSGASGAQSAALRSLMAVACVLEGYRYRFASEVQLHAGIAQALTTHGVAYEHERRASSACRYDFWLPDLRLVIEAKINGSLPVALRQVDRYVQLEDCECVLIAATKQWAAATPRYELRGKPIQLVRLLPQAF